MIAVRAALVLALALAACGYRPVYGGSAPSLHVKLVRSTIADAVASDEVVAGLREELARAGALASGESYPRVEIEVLRADEASEGVQATPAGPVSRATDVAIVARAWVVDAQGAEPRSETGDLRAEQTLAVDEGPSGPDPRASTFHHADALRAAARRVGKALGARVLGLPASTEETE
jgi:hypothetical protein